LDEPMGKLMSQNSKAFVHNVNPIWIIEQTTMK